MLKDDLFHRILIEPSRKNNVDRLQIVSGFATAGMADKHMRTLLKEGTRIGIDLIIGMTPLSGISKAQHVALQKLASERPYGMEFSCRYVVRGAPVHAKTYCWFCGHRPFRAYAGSANYTSRAFGRSQIEVMEAVAGPDAVGEFHSYALRNAENCLKSGIEDDIAIHDRNLDFGHRSSYGTGKDSVRLSLLVKSTGKTPEKSGINWGQRSGREPDQAYINIPVDIGRSGFFPDRGVPFAVLTDDHCSMIMVRAQDSGKGLETTQSNALLGKYLRMRMGVESGDYVTEEHLLAYGREDVTFSKIDEETYLMDFRPNQEAGR